jgi:MoaA/NifB/PqqE/SkfB family radical SAM enzyme
MIAWDHWHIEVSSICALHCPRCPRAEVPQSLLNTQLTLEFFQTRIGTHAVRQIRKITFCGNDGDPIYCREFLEICTWLKYINPDIHLTIITNGSYRPAAWWAGLAAVLNHRDEIHWSIDGWDQRSNNEYRVNSDWNSIMLGQSTFVSNNTSTYCVWATIAFKFNQDHLDHIRGQAQAAGMDGWQLTLSTKFGSRYPNQYGEHDSLEPTNANLVSESDRFTRRYTALSSKPRPDAELKTLFVSRHQSISNSTAVCMIGNKGIFVNSRGELYPCCWVANRYDHNRQWHEMAQNQFNLYHHSVQDIQQHAFWHSPEFLRFDALECRTKCSPVRWQDPSHVSEW